MTQTAIQQADSITFNQLWEIISKAKIEDKKAIAALAILHSDELLRAERFAVYNMSASKAVMTANKLLHKVCNSADKVSFAIAILENITTESGENNE